MAIETQSRIDLLDQHTREVIDHWVARFPPEHKRSAVLQSLNAAQHQNQGFLTTELMDAVAEYLDLPAIHVYEVASFYSMFETKPVARHNVAICTNICCMLMGSPQGDHDVCERLKHRDRYSRWHQVREDDMAT